MVSRAHSNTAIRTEGVFVCIRYKNFSIWKMCLQHYVANICRNDAAAVFSRGTRNVMKKKLNSRKISLLTYFIAASQKKKKPPGRRWKKCCGRPHRKNRARVHKDFEMKSVRTRIWHNMHGKGRCRYACAMLNSIYIYICVLEPTTPHPNFL